MKNPSEKVSLISSYLKTTIFKMMALTVLWNGQINESYCQQNLTPKYGIKGGVFSTFHTINDFAAMMPGFKLGWVYTDESGNQTSVSPFITTLVNRVEVQKNNYGSTLYLDLMIAGLQFDHSRWSFSTFKFTAHLDLGMGFANQHFGNFDSDLESSYLMYTLRPGLLVSKKLTDSLSISGGISYSIIAGSKYFILPYQELSGIQFRGELSIFVPI